MVFWQDRFVPYHKSNFMGIRRFTEMKKKYHTAYGKLKLSILASNSKKLMQFAFECDQMHFNICISIHYYQETDMLMNSFQTPKWLIIQSFVHLDQINTQIFQLMQRK